MAKFKEVNARQPSDISAGAGKSGEKTLKEC